MAILVYILFLPSVIKRKLEVTQIIAWFMLQRIREACKNDTCDYVFTNNFRKWTKQSLSNELNSVVDITFGKNSKITFHTLRHSFASYLITNGVEIFTVSKLLGHANVATTQIYSHLRNEHLQHAIKAFNVNDNFIDDQ